MSAAVEIYTRPGCGYCSAAKALLQRKHVEFTEFDAGQNPAFRQEMLARAKGGTTFPQIFIDGFHVGGCDELYALEGAGKLDELLNGQKEPT
ncbi:MAG: glutaredoxin 3 [Afipia felis]|nr:glutaredoxin 3 [Afipia felis]